MTVVTFKKIGKTKIIRFEFRIILHEYTYILLQKELIECTETITGFCSLFTKKK